MTVAAVTVIAGLIALAALLALAPRPAFAAAGESISTYDTRIEVRADGRIRVEETIAYDFGENRRHGIIRTIPARFRYDDRRDRVYPIDDVTVTMDGGGVPFDRSADGGNQVLKVGDPDRTVSNAHTYVIGYTVRGALNSFADHEELYWNVIGHDWQVPIASGTAVITGPAAVGRVACFAGPAGSQLGCAGASTDGNSATFRQSRLGEGSGMSAVVSFPAGSVSVGAAILADRHDLVAAFRPTPLTTGGAGVLALLGVGAAVAIGWRVGRDRRYLGLLPGLAPERGETAVERRKPLFGAPPVVVEFGAPGNVRPGQVGTLFDERADVVDVTATIVDFAVRRHLRIVEIVEAERDWELVKLTEGDPAFLPYERTLFEALFAGRDRVRLSELKTTFTADLAKVRDQLYADLVQQGWYRQSPARTRTVARTVAVFVLLAAVGLTALLAVFTQVALVGVGLVVAAVVLLAVAGSFPARTGRGSAVLARLQGLRLYISMAEAEQIKFQEREQIFSTFLPYAIVFGLAERWAGIFAKIGVGQPGGINGLYWYGGQPGWSLLVFSQSIGGFSSTAAGAMATAAPSASGSSGFSGGFSGGGGGGGGGGSW